MGVGVEGLGVPDLCMGERAAGDSRPSSMECFRESDWFFVGGGVGHLRWPVEACVLYGLPEELQAEPAGSLIGGGLCLTPLPKTEDWTNAEKPSASVSRVGEI